MKILLLSFYFPPDLSAGSFRAEALVSALLLAGQSDVEIDVITTLPNRYSTYQPKEGGCNSSVQVNVKKVKIPKHKSGMIDQAYSFSFFAREVVAVCRDEKYDLVIGTSSRLMTAGLAAVVAKICGARLHLDIRDLFVETLGDVLGKSFVRFVFANVLKWIELLVFRRADSINVVSLGFYDYVKRRAPNVAISNFTNGIDDIFLEKRSSQVRNSRGKTLLYAGNIGASQNLHLLVPQAAPLLSEDISVKIVGDGGRRSELETSIGVGYANVTLVDPVPRDKLLMLYAEADLLFFALSDADAFLKVLPSKLFEYAATGKPIVAGVAGYAAEFLREYVVGSYIFAPSDVGGMVACVKDALEGPDSYDRSDFVNRFSRSKIMLEYANSLLLEGANEGR